MKEQKQPRRNYASAVLATYLIRAIFNPKYAFLIPVLATFLTRAILAQITDISPL